MLLIAFVTAMTVELIANPPATAHRRGVNADALTNIGRFPMALGADSFTHLTNPAVPASDPLSANAPASPAVVAPASPASTTAPAARLTAVLIAEDGSVAVVDGDAVSVGGTLKTGERVVQILPDRVWVVSQNGRRSVLVLPGSGH